MAKLKTVELSDEDDELPRIGESILRIPQVELVYIGSAKLKATRKITGSQNVADIFREIIENKRIAIQEYFIAFFLNRSNKVIGYYILSKGGISGTVVDIRLLLIAAIKGLASGIVIAHNHPSGATHPSEQDRQITSKIRESAKLFDVSVLDHVIVTTESHFSFSDEGIMGSTDSSLYGLPTTDEDSSYSATTSTELDGFRAQAKRFLENE